MYAVSIWSHIALESPNFLEHIALNYSELRVKHKDFFFLIGGDKNDLDSRKLLDISPTLHMMNTKPTHGNKNIDVLISDMAHLYHESVILPSVPTDIPPSHQGGGQPSDHSVPGQWKTGSTLQPKKLSQRRLEE